MSKFTDLYIKKNQGRDTMSASEIADNPILALKKGISHADVRKSLESNGYPEDDIADIFEAYKRV